MIKESNSSNCVVKGKQITIIWVKISQVIEEREEKEEEEDDDDDDDDDDELKQKNA